MCFSFWQSMQRRQKQGERGKLPPIEVSVGEHPPAPALKIQVRGVANTREHEPAQGKLKKRQSHLGTEVL